MGKKTEPEEDRIFKPPKSPHFQTAADNHSPTGFAWGYGGSGPAQLALALLTDATGNAALALRHYQEFKRQFVANWGQSWSITASETRAFVAGQQRQSAGPISTARLA